MTFDPADLTALMKPNKKEKNQDEVTRAHDNIDLEYQQNGFFAVFSSKNFTDDPRQAMIHTNWKAHLSIHPDDLTRAWKIIYPILSEQAAHNKPITFKIIDHEKNDADIVRINNKLERLKKKTPANADLITNITEAAESALRFSNGLQVTLYTRNRSF